MLKIDVRNLGGLLHENLMRVLVDIDNWAYEINATVDVISLYEQPTKWKPRDHINEFPCRAAVLRVSGNLDSVLAAWVNQYYVYHPKHNHYHVAVWDKREGLVNVMVHDMTFKGTIERD